MTGSCCYCITTTGRQAGRHVLAGGRQACWEAAAGDLWHSTHARTRPAGSRAGLLLCYPLPLNQQTA